MGRFLYNLCLPLYLLVALPGWWIKMRRRGGYGARFAERFGWYDREVKASESAGGGAWWIHAVSVGEVLIAVKLMQGIRERCPEQRLLLSTTSSTGYATAKEKVPAGVTVVYHPLDLPGIGGRVLRQWRPAVLVLMESELWPNLIAAADRQGVPVVIANARLSPRSGRRYAKFRCLAAPTLNLLTAVLTQEESDAVRWEATGLRREKLVHTGSIKFDPAADKPPEPTQVEALRGVLGEVWGEVEGRHCLLLGSSHADEEEAVGAVYLRLRASFPELRLMVVPRHAERAQEVKAALESLGLAVVRRSRLAGAWATPGKEAAVLLVDTTGELRAWFALADSVIMGKSFLGEGGQNPVEPILAGRPVVTGPHMQNFAALTARLVEVGGMCQVQDMAELEVTLRQWVSDADVRRKLARAGQQALRSHAGATQRTVDKLLEITGNRA